MGQQEGIGGVGAVSEAWKKDQSAPHLPDGQRGGMQSASPPAMLHC